MSSKSILRLNRRRTGRTDEPSFTMSLNRRRTKSCADELVTLLIASHAKAGGAGRDRTDDLKLAKLPLSQLSYGPDQSHNAGERW